MFCHTANVWKGGFLSSVSAQFSLLIILKLLEDAKISQLIEDSILKKEGTIV